MARKKDKDKKKSEEEDEERNNVEDEEEVYEINTMEDYFRIMREVFSEIREFVKDTNLTLNVALSALKDIVPMVTSGNKDYSALSKILGDVNSVLKDYINKQERLAKKIASISRALSNQSNIENMLREFLLRPYRTTPDVEREAEKKEKDVIIPAVMVKDKKIIEKTFGVEAVGDDDSEEE